MMVGAGIAVGLLLVVALAVVLVMTRKKVDKPGPGGDNPQRASSPSVGVFPTAPKLPANLSEMEAKGTGFANFEYREFRQDESYLIGFEIGPGKKFANTDTIGFLRPI